MDRRAKLDALRALSYATLAGLCLAGGALVALAGAGAAWGFGRGAYAASAAWIALWAGTVGWTLAGAGVGMAYALMRTDPGLAKRLARARGARIAKTRKAADEAAKRMLDRLHLKKARS